MTKPTLPDCACGCGELTDIAKRTYTERGEFAGKPLEYRRGHKPRGMARIDCFWKNVQKTDTCWLWTGRTLFSRTETEYPYIWIKSETGQWRSTGAHRWSYEYFVGQIPDGYTIDHVKARGCSSTLCVNPAHLEAVTLKENIERADGIFVQHAKQAYCINGHLFDEENTYYRPRKEGGRACRRCARDRYRVNK